MYIIIICNSYYFKFTYIYYIYTSNKIFDVILYYKLFTNLYIHLLTEK